jgi:hypothetical protein
MCQIYKMCLTLKLDGFFLNGAWFLYQNDKYHIVLTRQVNIRPNYVTLIPNPKSEILKSFFLNISYSGIDKPYRNWCFLEGSF